MKLYDLFIGVLGFIMYIALYVGAVASPVQNYYEANNAYQSYIKKGNDLNDLGKIKEASVAYLKAYNNAVTNAQKKTALGSLAVTSFYLGKRMQSKLYLSELLSIFPNNRWVKRFAAQNNINLVKRSPADVAICKNISQGAYVPNQSLLSVDIQGIKNGIIPVGSTFDVTWKSDGSIPSHKKLYEFIVFTMPHTVRFNGSGFLMLPPEVKLPFGFEFAPDQMRVLFPLYLLEDKTQGKFKVRPLIAGKFPLKWAYLVVNECGEIVFSSAKTLTKKQLMTFDIQPKQNPTLVVQDRVGMEKPDKVFISPSGEYELRVFKKRFQVLYAETGELILERAGTSPNFSPGSRFIGYFPTTNKSYSPSIEIVDMLIKKVIAKYETFQVVAWGKNDSFLIIGFATWSHLEIIFPFLEENNSIFFSEGCHACDAWETTKLAIDLENALLHIAEYEADKYWAGVDIYSLIDEDNAHQPCGENECPSNDDYVSLLKRLGFVPNNTLFSLPERWKIEGGFKITHIGSEESGINKILFSSPILLTNPLTNPLPVEITSIENNKISLRGNFTNGTGAIKMRDKSM